MAVSILFLVQDVSITPKFSENDFWKIVSTSYRIGRIFGKGSVDELWGNGAYVGGMLQSYREQIHEKLKCVAQPYKMEVLTKVGRDLCWREREL